MGIRKIRRHENDNNNNEMHRRKEEAEKRETGEKNKAVFSGVSC